MPDKKRKNTLWRFMGLMKPGRFQYLVCLSAKALVDTAERIFVAYIVKLFIDAITMLDAPLLWSTIRMWVMFFVVISGVGYLAARAWRETIYRITANIRQAIFEKLQRLPLGYFEMRHSGQALSILTNDLSTAEQIYQDNLLVLVTALAQGISAAVFMLALQWELALIIFITGLLPLLINASFAKPLRKVGDEIQSRLGALSERLSDLLAGFQVVRTFNLGDWILSRFKDANDDGLDSGLRRVRLQAALATSNSIGVLVMMIPLFIGAYMVLKGHTTFGTIIALLQLRNQIEFLVYSLGDTISGIQGALAGADRILEVFETPSEPVRYNPDPMQSESGLLAPEREGTLLEFNNLDFHYGEQRTDSGEQNVLQEVNIAIRAGEVAAMVGPSGSGKSTLFKLLLGCYPASGGTIRVQSKPLNDFELEGLRDLFAYVPQDAYLYSGTILENIRYGKTDATQDEIFAAARAAYAHDFILEQPDGYQTMVGERGAKLSGGQRQRIAIARALLKNAPILLLDEATSALDSEAEQEVQKALNNLMQGRTTLVIAHRLSTVEHADTIYVLDGGKVVERGCHASLLETKGLYSQLYALQFKASGLAVAA